MIYSAFISLSSPKVVEKETKWSKPNKLSPDWTLWRSSASPLKLLYDQENWMQYGSKMFFGIGTPMVFWSSPPCHWIGGNNLAILGKFHSDTFLLLTEEILSITAGSDQGSYAKPLLCKRYRLTCGCMSPNFRPETTFSKVAGGRVRTADLQTRRLPLNPLLHGGLTCRKC